DSLISILSEKQTSIPELHEIVTAQRGFNIIATANTRDRGVNEMSAALKRRFNFVVVPVVEDLEQEIKIVTRFQEMRAGITKDGKTKVRTPNAVLSTAEAISVLFNSGILAASFGEGKVTA